MSAPSPWFTDFGRPATGAPRLLCLAGAGAFASEFHAWPAAFAGIADITAIVLPGRERRIRETGITDMDGLVREIAAELNEVIDSEQPFSLFGHSLGALVMFELARHLRSVAGHRPSRLFVSAQSAPGVRETHPPAASTDAELVDYIRSFGGAPEDVLANAAFMAAYFPGMRADLALYENYRYLPEPLVDQPITTYRGGSDHTIDPADMRGWAAVTGGPCTAVEIDGGGHLFLRTHLDELVADIGARLSEVSPAGHAG
ncbi:thioesterase II family protein [Nocardia sienata]|uniref:thioesterase II family protein n=1 Tax=Nocardia sienata TaxID=248552 RepID=UPI0007A4ED60|nr:alpha/beta fold hydrolase [Nocardia sienata]